jgi:hypothetical protein
LFHEVCTELGIPATLVLPIPVGNYRRDSVADGGAEWIEGFNKLVVVNEPVILSDSNELSVWAKSTHLTFSCTHSSINLAISKLFFSSIIM